MQKWWKPDSLLYSQVCFSNLFPSVSSHCAKNIFRSTLSVHWMATVGTVAIFWGVGVGGITLYWPLGCSHTCFCRQCIPSQSVGQISIPGCRQNRLSCLCLAGCWRSDHRKLTQRRRRSRTRTHMRARTHVHTAQLNAGHGHRLWYCYWLGHTSILTAFVGFGGSHGQHVETFMQDCSSGFHQGTKVTFSPH